MGTMRPLVKAQNDSSSAKSQEIPVSMDNVCPDGNENQYVTSTSVETLGSNVNVRYSECIRNSPHRYNPGFGAARDIEERQRRFRLGG